jgi:pantetheine-phosphate adenylyltransferase
MRAVYAGTFDPVTNGHLGVVRRALMLFGEVVILIAENKAKTPMFSLPERLQLLHEALAHANIDHAYPMYTHQYVAQWCRQGDVLVRGIRNASDLEYEAQVAAFNRNPKVPDHGGRVCYPMSLETVWLPATDAAISSSTARSMALANDPDLPYCVPAPVARALMKKVENA